MNRAFAYTARESQALHDIERAIGQVCAVVRTFTVQHVREQLERNGIDSSQSLYRRLTYAAFCRARKKGLCRLSADGFVPTADDRRLSKSARRIWEPCSAVASS